MQNKELIAYVSQQLKSGEDVDYIYNIKGIEYKVKFLAPRETKGFNIPSILAIPITDRMNTQIVVEANNLESGDLEKILEQGTQTGITLATLTNNKPSPILVPLIPSYKDAPYFQQLSKECLELPNNDRNYRIDEQIVRIIQNARSIIEAETGITTDEKIFLNGYSSSGVFAQRFALLHPELVETACIGGASGSIPIPSAKIGYPIGIEDYETLLGKKFDLKSYSKRKKGRKGRRYCLPLSGGRYIIYPIMEQYVCSEAVKDEVKDKWHMLSLAAFIPMI